MLFVHSNKSAFRKDVGKKGEDVQSCILYNGVCKRGMTEEICQKLYHIHVVLRERVESMKKHKGSC